MLVKDSKDVWLCDFFGWEIAYVRSVWTCPETFVLSQKANR